MARGVGSLTVSVNANTAKAQQNLKLFRGEMKSVAMDAQNGGGVPGQQARRLRQEIWRV